MADQAVPYRYDEDKIIADIQSYIDSTYGGHYSEGRRSQVFDSIIDSGHGLGFAVGNMIKYSQRLGRKAGFNELDVMKAIHYGIFVIGRLREEKPQFNAAYANKSVPNYVKDLAPGTQPLTTGVVAPVPTTGVAAAQIGGSTASVSGQFTNTLPGVAVQK